MAETITTIIAWTVCSLWIGAHFALFGWAFSLAGREAQRAVAILGSLLAVLLVGMAGCTHYIAN